MIQGQRAGAVIRDECACAPVRLSRLTVFSFGEDSADLARRRALRFGGLLLSLVQKSYSPLPFVSCRRGFSAPFDCAAWLGG